MQTNGTITAIKGVKVGHSSSTRNMTGCTVLLMDHPSIAAVDSRGGWPGTYDTDSLGPAKTFFRKHAIFLVGGDVYGLNCAAGIQRYLVERRIASKEAPGELPGVVGADIYDIEFGRNVPNTNYLKLGYNACQNATSEKVLEGNQGAGLGATIGKLKGIHFATKGGIGSSLIEITRDVKVGALVVCNAIGNVFDDSGRTIAGTHRDLGSSQYVEIEELGRQYVNHDTTIPRATTIGIVVTNIRLTHEQALKVAEMAHDGLARCIRPVHTTTDGDTLFCTSTEQYKSDVSNRFLDAIGHAASTQVAQSVLSAVQKAKSLNRIPSMMDTRVATNEKILPTRTPSF